MSTRHIPTPYTRLEDVELFNTIHTYKASLSGVERAAAWGMLIAPTPTARGKLRKTREGKLSRCLLIFVVSANVVIVFQSPSPVLPRVLVFHEFPVCITHTCTCTCLGYVVRLLRTGVGMDSRSLHGERTSFRGNRTFAWQKEDRSPSRGRSRMRSPSRSRGRSWTRSRDRSSRNSRRRSRSRPVKRWRRYSGLTTKHPMEHILKIRNFKWDARRVLGNLLEIANEYDVSIVDTCDYRQNFSYNEWRTLYIQYSTEESKANAEEAILALCVHNDNTKHKLRVRIPKQLRAGRLIGVACENMRALEVRHNVHIDYNGGQRVVTIMALNDPEARERCLRDIEERLATSVPLVPLETSKPTEVAKRDSADIASLSGTRTKNVNVDPIETAANSAASLLSSMTPILSPQSGNNTMPPSPPPPPPPMPPVLPLVPPFTFSALKIDNFAHAWLNFSELSIFQDLLRDMHPAFEKFYAERLSQSFNQQMNHIATEICEARRNYGMGGLPPPGAPPTPSSPYQERS